MIFLSVKYFNIELQYMPEPNYETHTEFGRTCAGPEYSLVVPCDTKLEVSLFTVRPHTSCKTCLEFVARTLTDSLTQA